jgi:tetratricopeptide (TPR) repeat protein
MLERAKAVMNDKPDSALAVLDSLGQHESEFGKGFRMRYRLHRLNALNKVDTLFRSTDEARELADYFDDHGTPNEQMLAYYLLGRAYYDIHEAPMALSCFQTASEKADTTAADCDFRQLSRVYGQMSNIFYQQGLYEQELECEDLSARYGWKGNDPLTAICSLAGKIYVYKKQKKSDSAIIICEKTINLLDSCGYRKQSASYYATILRELVDKGDILKAKEYMAKYENESGYFDSNNNIEKGREAYYYSKGYYFMAINVYDSAEYYFRKELRDGKDFNNQNGGSRGLALLFQKTHQPDSAAKYALYSYEMNDSVYAQRAMKEVEKVQGMYDYSRNQIIAEKAKEKAEREQRIVWAVLSILVLLMMVSAYIAREVYKKRQEMQEAYSRKVSDLAKAQADIVRLRSLAEHTEELSTLIAEKETEMQKMAIEIDSYKEKLGTQRESAESRLEESDIYHELKKKAGKAVELTNDDWHQVNVLAIETLPHFYKFISSKKLELNDKEFKICMLVRMHFAPKDIANMLGVSQAYITKLRNNMMPKLFGMEGSSKELDEKLMQFT